ncbi:hypothetical protein CYY_008486 [Polysphondylium violaceum]|uniref:Sugar phosphate transporter domain-containing protein n=1 Tax=Polysphondylium violaceum TaxID=133409 RepID=A0A8J4PV51_9MYCE|nr:hypothetical protein CYY_008486 [Polysphondylium violaceum]
MTTIKNNNSFHLLEKDSDDNDKSSLHNNNNDNDNHNDTLLVTKDTEKQDDDENENKYYKKEFILNLDHRQLLSYIWDQIRKAYENDTIKSAFAVVLYGTVSLCQTIFNKKVMTTFDYEGSNILLFLQMIVTIIILQLLNYFQILKVNTTLSYDIVKKLSPLSFCYIINVLLGLDSLKALNIPMYSALKRLVAVAILVMEYFILNKVSPPKVVASVIVMVFGAIIAGFTDLSFNSLAYTLVLTSCLFQASYLIFVKKIARNMPTYDMLYYNSVLSLPIIIVLMLYRDEVTYFRSYQYLDNPYFQLYFTLSVFLGFFLNFCIFFCTSVNSPLTTSVTGQVKNIASTIIGAMVFKDIIIQPFNIFGLVVNIIGSIWYSFLKLTS